MFCTHSLKVKLFPKKNSVFAIESVSIFSLANAELFFFWSVLMPMFVLMNSHSSIDITLYVNLFSKIDFEGNAARLPFCLFLLFLMEIWLWRIKDWLWEAKLNEAFSAGNCEMIFSFFLLFSAKKPFLLFSVFFFFNSLQRNVYQDKHYENNGSNFLDERKTMNSKSYWKFFFGLQQKNGRLKVNQLFNKVCSKRYGTKNIGSFIKFIADWFFPKTKRLKNYFFTKQTNHHHKNILSFNFLTNIILRKSFSNSPSNRGLLRQLKLQKICCMSK